MDNLCVSNYFTDNAHNVYIIFIFSVQLWRNIYSRNPELCHKPKMKGMLVIIDSINLIVMIEIIYDGHVPNWGCPFRNHWLKLSNMQCVLTLTYMYL